MAFFAPVKHAGDEPAHWLEEHSMGTSIMATTYKDGVVLGADSRTSTGAYIANRVSDKISDVTDRIYCCRSGSAADTQAIRDYVKRWTEDNSIQLGKPATVKTAANLFQLLCYNNKNNLTAGIIVAGYDDEDGPSVYSIPLGGACIKQKFAIGGSGSTYIYGHCDTKFKEDMSREEAEQVASAMPVVASRLFVLTFVLEALALAMARDGSSGGVIRLCTITKEEVVRQYVPGNKIPKTAYQG